MSENNVREYHIQEKLAFADIITDYRCKLIEHKDLKYTFEITLGGEFLDKVLIDFINVQAEKEKPHIKGFGAKIPMPVLIRHYGKKFAEGVYKGARNLYDYVLTTEIRRAVEYAKTAFKVSNGLDPIFIHTPSRVDAGHEQTGYKYANYTYTVSVEQMPMLPKIDVSTISIQTPVCHLTDVDIKEKMQIWADNNTRGVVLAKSRVIEAGDTVEIKLSIPGKDETLDRFKVVVGQGKLNPDCENQLIGKDIGGTFEYNFNLPKNFSDPSIAGRSYRIKVEVQAIFGTEKYKIDEDMARHFGYSTIEQCVQYFRDQAESEIDEQLEYVNKMRLRSAIGELYDIELPQQIYNQYMLERHDRLAKEIGMNLQYPLSTKNLEATKEIMQKMYGYDYDTWLVEERKSVVSDIKADLALAKLAREVKIAVSGQELDSAIAAQAGSFKNGLKEAVKYYDDNQGEFEKLHKQLLEQKIVEYVLHLVKRVDFEVNYKQLREIVWIGCRSNVTLSEKGLYEYKGISDQVSKVKKVEGEVKGGKKVEGERDGKKVKDEVKSEKKVEGEMKSRKSVESEGDGKKVKSEVKGGKKVEGEMKSRKSEDGGSGKKVEGEVKSGKNVKKEV